jgi:hypothetical protein
LSYRRAHRKPLSETMGGAVLPFPLVLPHPSEVQLRKPVTVRFWAAAHLDLEPPTGSDSWQAVAPSSAAGEEALPDLELQAANAETPLEIKCVPGADAPLADVVADRVLLEVGVLPQERLRYRARYWLSRIRSDHVQVVLPAPMHALLFDVEPAVKLDNNVWSLKAVLETAGGTEARHQTVLRVPVEPQLLTRPALLEIRFLWNAPAGRLARYDSWLPAPLLGGRVALGQVRWRVELPTGRLPLYHSRSYLGEQPWRWLGWLRPPQPSWLAARAQSWLAPGLEPPPLPHERPALSYAQLGVASPLEIIHVPQHLWLLVCSLAILLPGISWYYFPARHPLVWLGLLVLGVAALGLVAPELLWAVAFGVQPGLVVLGGALAWLGLRQRRWRRQVVRLPGFTRRKAGSSFGQAGSPPRSAVLRPAREPSTVDAPPANGSGLRDAQ